MTYTNNFELNNGVKIPALGLGTWLLNDEQTEQAVIDAISLGYRHIDTAQAYGNEKGVGEGVRKSGVDRQELFITTKVAAEEKTYEGAAASIDESLRKTGLDYFDLMIIHSPQPWKEVNQSDDRYFEGNIQAWKALEAAYKAGKVRAIGVSNFLREDLENLLENTEIKPMVNQVLCHIGNTPLELIEFCQSKEIQVEAYSPIGHGAILNRKDVKAIATKYDVSVAQLSLKYALQLGIVVIPKTSNPAHMKNNAALNFEISDADMETLKTIEKIDDYGDHSFFPVFGGKL
ncbi:aldo/keto reductase [Enterococcus avium]|uniref:aldo/keto reductase n=1 Tax=Enterococcus avium TaxID=33945 RepID=UPI00163BC99A|nr:aldo/keto reductase [Enterococcus avium]